MIDMENHENENRIPNHVIDNLARCLLPKIQTYFETENGQLAFQAWAEDNKNISAYLNLLFYSETRLQNSHGLCHGSFAYSQVTEYRSCAERTLHSRTD